MQKNNRSLSKSAVLLVAILAFLDASCSDIFGGQSAGYTSVQDTDYTPIRKLRAKLSLKSEKVQ